MQLIEIIQLALILFIALSIVIFLFSYVGYRRKSKTEDFKSTKVNDKKVEIVPPKVVEELPVKPEPVKEIESIKKSQRFEVFIPDVETDVKSDPQKNLKKKSHHPKTLTIKHKR
ncbi:MAG TPA: hypothetical protein PL018_13470 [Ignavibacteriaceae bacterium]|nr:hypothetical protein [Ignavibacterium sp.]HMN23819.1 hypothetical protein [Ignavibacteriaceae bacterium]HRN27550.1 hypothetical protein [Ignavibacteriaceae bacterium]HRQ55261.1 hypothetical protein [Ignavibacteriaceae bacterium]